MPEPAHSDGVGPTFANGRSKPQAERWLLLVEDNRINQVVAVRRLEKRGFRLDMASNEQLALEKYRSRPYAVIFIDCYMPVLDGYETTAEIRRREPEGQHVPILAMTAHTIEGDREVPRRRHGRLHR